MNIKEKLSLIEEMLELEAGSLSPEDRLDKYEQWDSLAALSLIVLLDENFGKQISGEKIKGLKTINDILRIMESP